MTNQLSCLIRQTPVNGSMYRQTILYGLSGMQPSHFLTGIHRLDNGTEVDSNPSLVDTRDDAVFHFGGIGLPERPVLLCAARIIIALAREQQRHIVERV